MAKHKFKRNIVIVCEGTETENHYFSEIKKSVRGDFWADIKIVPEPEIEKTSRANNKRPKRTFVGGNKNECRYMENTVKLTTQKRIKLTT